MSAKAFVLAGLILLAIGGLGLWLRARRAGAAARERPPAPEGYFIATTSESAARAASVLPTEGSEDKRALLTPPQLPAEEEEDSESTKSYLPDPQNDWSLRVAAGKSATLRRKQVLELLDPAWSKTHGLPEIYGREAESGRWTFLRAGGVPEEHSELLVAWNLSPRAGPEWVPPTPDALLGYRRELESRLSPVGAQVVDASAPPEVAARRARELAALKEEADREAIIQLRAPSGRPFEGRAVWDVMLALGLEWGDMDLFHWNNISSTGDDHLFSVWTSTAPGYFLPEEIAAGRVKSADLVFGFSIPRSPAPEQVFASMARAARYAQHRMGGELLDSEDAPLDDTAVLSEIERTVSLLRRHGFEPGQGRTLYVF